MSQEPKKALGRILLEQKAISPEELNRALAEGVPGSAPLATRLTESGVVTELDALKALSAQRGVPGIDLNQICIKLSELTSIPRDIALVHKLLPVLERPDRIFVAMAKPEEKKVIEELEFVTGRRVFAYIALEGVLMRTVRDAYDARDRGEEYFVGAACPAETLERAGLNPEAYGKTRAPEPQAAPPPPAPPPAPVRAAAPVTEERPPPRKPPPPIARTESPAPVAPRGAPSAPGRPSPVPGRPPPPSRSLSPFPSPVRSRPVVPRDDPEPPPPSAADAFRSRPTGTEQRFRPSMVGMQAVQNPVVVDEKMQHAGLQEVNEADFGDVAEELAIEEAPPRRASRPPAPGQKKILIVDDEPDIRRLIRRVLEERGHAVVEADRGKLALQLVKQENPDLVVLDAMLPEVHGFDIARRIRGSSRYGHIPIVMVSAVYRGWRFAQDAKQSYGVDAYIEKPFKVQELVGVVEAALQRERTGVDPEVMNGDAETLLKDGVAAYQAGDIEKATGLLEQGVQIDPLAYRLRFHLGLLYGKRGQIYDAIEQLERAVQMQSQHFASVKNLAILYQQAGFKNKAMEAWERALAIAPNDETRKAIKEHIVSLL